MGPFHSPYAGTKSFVSESELRTTATATLFFAAKLPWEGGMLIINPEEAGGRGTGDVFGLADAHQWRSRACGQPAANPLLRPIHATANNLLGGEWEKLADIANQIPGPRYKNNIVIKLGKMACHR